MTNPNSTAATPDATPVPYSFTPLRPATLKKLAIQLFGNGDNARLDRGSFDPAAGTISLTPVESQDYCAAELFGPAEGATLERHTIICASSDPLEVFHWHLKDQRYVLKSRVLVWTTTGWQEPAPDNFALMIAAESSSKYYYKVILDKVDRTSTGSFYAHSAQSELPVTLEFFAVRPFPGFRASYPIDFRLYDDDQQSVLYIDNGPKGAIGATGYPLHLELHNRSGRDIRFEEAADPQATDPKAPPTATAENHHLELQFRAGTLSPNTLQAVKEAKVKIEERSWGNTPPDNHSPWAFGISDEKSGEPVSLYLLRQGTAQVLAADQRCELNLTPMAADAGQGARGAQVTLRSSQMTYAKPEGSPVVADRTKQLYIGHFRRRDVPLRVGFLGPSSNRISHDGADSVLRLRITNTYPTSVNASQSGSEAKLILKFDYGDDSWDLCSAEAAKSIKVSRKWPAEKKDTPVPPFLRGQGQEPEWRIELPESGLEPGKHVEVLIEIGQGISHPHPGDTNLYVDYENIPGYGEGRFICTVDRSPLVLDGEKVGIGRKDPKYSLDVHGNFHADGTLMVTGAAPLPSEGAGAVLQADSKTGSGHVFAYDYTAKTPKPLVLQDPGGNVGIGVLDPKRRLDVNGDIEASKTISANEVHAAKITSDGDIKASKNITANEVHAAKITSDGDIKASKNITAREVRAAKITSDGDIEASKNITANEVHADEMMTVGDRLLLKKPHNNRYWAIEISDDHDALTFRYFDQAVAYLTTSGEWHKVRKKTNEE